MMADKKMTEFGLRVYNLAAERAAIYNWAQLERRLQASGYSISRQQISNYVYGESVATAEFVRHFSEEIDLNEDECKELAFLWGFGQEREGKETYRTPVYKVAEKLGWGEDERRDAAYHYIFGAGVVSMSA